jgi:hypothetical protein
MRQLLVAAWVLVPGVALAGTLYGRIVKPDGSPLAKTEVVIEGKKVTTNEFGGYRLVLPDGARELQATVGGVGYTSDRIEVYSPETKQNWRLDPEKKRMTAIR